MNTFVESQRLQVSQRANVRPIGLRRKLRAQVERVTIIPTSFVGAHVSPLPAEPAKSPITMPSMTLYKFFLKTLADTKSLGFDPATHWYVAFALDDATLRKSRVGKSGQTIAQLITDSDASAMRKLAELTIAESPAALDPKLAMTSRTEIPSALLRGEVTFAIQPVDEDRVAIFRHRAAAAPTGAPAQTTSTTARRQHATAMFGGHVLLVPVEAPFTVPKK